MKPGKRPDWLDETPDSNTGLARLRSNASAHGWCCSTVQAARSSTLI